MEIKRPKSNQPLPENAKRVFQGKLFDVYQWEQELYDGSKAIFEKIKRPDTVVVYAVADDGKIILIKQEQPGITHYFTSTFGGRVDEGEDILVAAKRELLEEGGFEAKEFILWNSQQPLNKIEWSVYTFIAKGLRKVNNPNLDAGEKIEPLQVTFDQLIDIVTNDCFSEREMVMEFMRAKYEPEKRKELEQLFKPINAN